LLESGGKHLSMFATSKKKKKVTKKKRRRRKDDFMQDVFQIQGKGGGENKSSRATGKRYVVPIQHPLGENIGERVYKKFSKLSQVAGIEERESRVDLVLEKKKGIK